MEIYSQKDPRWAAMQLGESGLTMEHWGCTITAVAQALTLAGWGVTPGDLVGALNNNGGFTKDGLILWAKIGEAYPQFHFGGGGYAFIQGIWGKYQHWVLKDMSTGQVYDPFYAATRPPAGFMETGRIRTAAIDRRPEPQPEPEPTPEPQPEEPETPARTYKVVKGDSLWNIVKAQYGLTNAGEIAKKVGEIVEENNIENPDLIFPDQIIVLP